VRQPDIRFVSIKPVDQQAMLAWHRTRSGYQMERTALVNRMRGLLAEFGVWIGRSSAVLELVLAVHRAQVSRCWFLALFDDM
jgi:transposase